MITRRGNIFPEQDGRGILLFRDISKHYTKLFTVIRMKKSEVIFLQSIAKILKEEKVKI